MWNNTNPAELYPSTTWELITAGKYIQSGSTALSTGGSNSVSISKANLPSISIKVNSFSVTTQTHEHSLTVKSEGGSSFSGRPENVATGNGSQTSGPHMLNTSKNKANSGGGQNTGTASPSTETLGSGTALSIQPAYITLKFWKRLS